MSMSDDAMKFFDACERGKGWDACKAYCADGATFSCQADTLAEIKSLEAYTEWMKGMFTLTPDGRYELNGFAADEGRNTVLAFGVFKGTHTEEGGPVPPTGKSVAADYVYAMEFEGGKIRHMTKVWNDGHSLRQLGWA